MAGPIQDFQVTRWRPLFLLGALLIIGVVAPIVETLLQGIGALLTEGAIAISLFAVLMTGRFSKTLFWVAVFLLALNVASTASWLIADSVAARRTASASGFVFLCVLAVSAIRAILEPGPVTIDKMVIAICVYLMIGVGWAELYHLIYSINPSSFEGIGEVAGHQLSWRLNYFSFVTLTTLGYGDILPVTPLAQSITVIETLVGQMYLAVLVAALVSAYLAENRE